MRGLLSLEAMGAKVEAGEIDTIVVGFTDHYGRVHGKRFDANYFMTDAAAHGTHGCDYLLTADMEMEPVPGYTYANWELGYGDVHLVPDLPTLRVASWLDRTAMVLLCDLHDPHDHTLVGVAPRSILRSSIGPSSRATPLQGASELEYFIYLDSYRQAAIVIKTSPRPAGTSRTITCCRAPAREHYNGAVRRQLAASGIPVESSKGEWAAGTR